MKWLFLAMLAIAILAFIRGGLVYQDERVCQENRWSEGPGYTCNDE